MKTLIASLMFLWMAAPSHAQANAASTDVPAQAQTEGILQSVENADLQSSGDHVLVTRKDSSLPVEMVFKSSLGVGIHREREQWWVLPPSRSRQPD